MALTSVRREYQRDFRMTLQRPEPPLTRPRELNPAPELDKASGTEYMIEHWLACSVPGRRP